MAVKPFSKEELNFFKFSSIVLDEFPKALRQTFISIWDSKVGALAGYQVWDDSVVVRNMLLASEGGKTDIPINKSIQDWDSTALFKATIFAKTFRLTSSKKTLAEFYVKGRKLKPSPFHPTVNSPSGDQNETLTLAIDQLRLLRNTLCHAAEPRITKPDFDQYVQLAKDAFIAVSVPTASIDAIGSLSEADFPTATVNALKEHLQKELQASNTFLQDKVIDKISDIDERTEALSVQLIGIREAQETTNEEFKEEFKEIKSELIHKIESEAEKLNSDGKCNIPGNPSSLPASCLPAKVPHFTGRKEECKKIMASLTSESTRLVSICGSPGFGKTSTAIAIGHDLQSQRQSVYFFTFRGISTKDEFISKLLSLFKRSTKSSLNAILTPADELCRIFEEIHSRFFVILDNLDDLLECSKSNNNESKSLKDDILHFIEEILGRCQSVRFLTTTRESLHFLNFRIVGNESIRIGPLDPQSSESLVSEFLTRADKAITTQIARICGNVALAIKLLCSLIKEDNLAPNDCLDDICKSSEDILEIIDNPSYPTDLRIKNLFQSSFKKLSTRKEQEAFVSLSVFAGVDFDFDAAVAVVGGDKFQAKKTLGNLEKKSLIDLSSRIDSNLGGKFQAQKRLGNLEKISLIDSPNDSKTFSLHPLLQSFAIEKGDSENELKEVVISSKNRLYHYYIHLFGELNKQFLTGGSMTAFVKFYREEKNIWLSFHAGFQNEGLLKKLFDVLTKAELLLHALYPFNWEQVKSLYDLALKKAQEQGNDEAYASLAVSKCFITLRAENNETKEKIYSLPAATTAKYLCYEGMAVLYHGRSEFGIEQIQNGLLDLNDSASHKILKVMALQLLTFYYDFSGNSEISTQFSKTAIAECKALGDWGLLLAIAFEDNEKRIRERILCESTTLLNHAPLILWAISRLSIHASKYLCVQMNMNLSTTVEVMQTQILEKESPVLNRALATLLQACNLALMFLYSNDEATVQDIEKAIEVEKNIVNQNNKHKMESRKTDRQNLLERRLAEYYNCTGLRYSFEEKYSLALESYQKELRIRMELHNEPHPNTAICYNIIGCLQNAMKDYTSALKSYHHALDIRLNLYGVQHADTAHSYNSTGVVQNNMNDYTSALQSYQRALDIRLKLYGEQHGDTADSYNNIGHVQYNMKDYTSALESHHRALDIRLKLYGKQHADTANSYNNIGVVQHIMKDYTSALQSYQRALDIKLELYGEQHADTANFYKNIGVVQDNMKEYTSALRSYQRALDIRLKLYGEQHVDTAESFYSIGLVQCTMKDYTSALQSFQCALDIMIKCCGEQHATTTIYYENLRDLQRMLARTANGSHADASD